MEDRVCVGNLDEGHSKFKSLMRFLCVRLIVRRLDFFFTQILEERLA